MPSDLILDKPPANPTCPGCGKSPFNVNQCFHTFPNTKASYTIVWCVDCGELISVQYIGQNETLQVVASMPKGFRPS